jgi:hypothetical protein
MATNFIRGDVIEVPLPSDYQDQQCLPLVIMQPTADATSYMLKENYATNGQPGVVDHALVADTANSVDWNNLTDRPNLFPPIVHGIQHLSTGNDPIPDANIHSDGLCPKGSGQASDYLGGDVIYHPLPPVARWVSELPVTIDPSATNGAVLVSTTVANPVPAVYEIDEFYLYDCNQAYPPAGMVHFDLYDPAIPGWVQVTSSTDISVMTALNYLLRPILLSAAMIRVFVAPGPNGQQWRLVLDTAPAKQVYFRAGVGLRSYQAQTL